jgi:hypothetical protein
MMSYRFNSYADNTAHITIVTSSTGPVNKKIYLQDGKICKDPNAQIYQGFAKTVAANTSEDLREVITNLSQKEAIALGQLKQIRQSFPLTTRAELYAGSIARTQDYFYHALSKGWLLLDVDTKDLPLQIKDKLAGCSIFVVLLSIIPELLLTEMLVRPSSSAGIVKPDGSEREATGLHIFVKVANQRQSQKMLQLIHDRCWEAGYGFFALARDGKLLERSLIDTTVHGPERLVFEANPNVLPPLKKRYIPDEVFFGGVLSYIEEPNHEKVYYLKKEARNLKKPETKKAKRQHLEDKTIKVMAETGLSRAKASKIVKQRLEGRELAEHDILELSKNKFVKVSDLLDNAKGPIGMPCPIEGTEYGTTTAYFYPVDDYSPYPRIISYAHGNRTEFTFTRYRHLKGLVWLPKPIEKGGL